ncbi:MAG: right-handed parallel beta-helix repeat-containing protein [Phycisphaerales bacterium]|nr:MAG: right-handed parallel beta-helix repeat-containing protein [Phycisphaerales bacterium]
MRSWIVIIAIVLSGLASNAQGKKIHVKAGATGDGSSWANAYGDLQAALDDAEPNDDIWVAEGTYTPTGLADPCDPRSATFQMNSAVAIYGGFPATGEPGWDDRDRQVYVTILSGDLLGNDEPSTSVADLLDDPCRCENSYHVVTGTNTESAPNTLLDGFTITAGNADDWPNQSGGGLYRYSGLVNECTITGNSARSGSGGMQCEAGHTTVTGCAFTRNSAYHGGGMKLPCFYKVTVSRCTFSNNFANDGGGIYNYSTLSLTDCTFTRN